MKTKFRPKELDQQSPIRIDRWLAIDSEECRAKDPDVAFTKKCLRLGMEESAGSEPFLFTDSLGRVWGKGKDGTYYPFHFNIGETNYGFRIPQKAAN